MVARGVGADAGRVGELEDFVGGSSGFESSDFLEVLAFEEDGGVGEGVEGLVGEEEGFVDVGGDSGVGQDDVFFCWLVLHGVGGMGINYLN